MKADIISYEEQNEILYVTSISFSRWSVKWSN